VKIIEVDQLSRLANNNTEGGFMVDKRLSDYLAKIGSKGGKAGSAKMTKAQRIKRAKAARAAQLKNKKGGAK
jgi:hypothetical protein